MEEFKNALFSGNVVAWVVVVVAVVIAIQVIRSMGKAFILVAVLVLVGFLISQFFPDLVAPIADFVAGGWMSSGAQ